MTVRKFLFWLLNWRIQANNSTLFSLPSFLPSFLFFSFRFFSFVFFFFWFVFFLFLAPSRSFLGSGCSPFKCSCICAVFDTGSPNPRSGCLFAPKLSDLNNVLNTWIWGGAYFASNLDGNWNECGDGIPPPLGFWHKGGIGKECKFFQSNLADKISHKNGKSYASAMSWRRTCISFDILGSVHTCVWGSRTPFHKNEDFLDDFSVRNANIFQFSFLIIFSGLVSRPCILFF